MTLEQLNIISQYAEKNALYYKDAIKSRMIFSGCPILSNMSLEELIERRDYFKAVLNNVNAQIEEFIKVTVIL